MRRLAKGFLLWYAFERRRRHRLLTEFLDQLDAENGPVDEALVEKYARLCLP